MQECFFVWGGSFLLVYRIYKPYVNSIIIYIGILILFIILERWAHNNPYIYIYIYIYTKYSTSITNYTNTNMLS